MNTPTPLDAPVRRSVLSEHDIMRRAQAARAEAMANGFRALGRVLRRSGLVLVARLSRRDQVGRAGTAYPVRAANAAQRERDAA